MEIKVILEQGKLSFSPDPAVVKKGTPVSWRFQVEKDRFRSLRWTIYFEKGSPFKSQDDHFVTETSDSGQHDTASSPIAADTPGDYKYGVRVMDSDSQKILGDDDPRLIVRDY